MVGTEAGQLKLRFPYLTLLVTAGALGIYASAGLTSLFIYDRAKILDGQYWRLLTANLVHFSALHLGFNLLGFAVVGFLAESLGRRRFMLLLAAVAVATGFSLLALVPDLYRYGGLSALVYGTAFYLALNLACLPRPWKGIAVLMLVLLPGKVLCDAWYGGFSPEQGGSIKIVWQGHAMAMAVALVYFLYLYRQNIAGYCRVRAKLTY